MNTFAISWTIHRNLRYSNFSPLLLTYSVLLFKCSNFISIFKLLRILLWNKLLLNTLGMHLDLPTYNPFFGLFIVFLSILHLWTLPFSLKSTCNVSLRTCLLLRNLLVFVFQSVSLLSLCFWKILLLGIEF